MRKLVGIILLLVLLYLFLGLIRIYPIFKGEYVPLQEVTERISTHVWKVRITDTITQAFILFSALVGVLSLWK